MLEVHPMDPLFFFLYTSGRPLLFSSSTKKRMRRSLVGPQGRGSNSMGLLGFLQGRPRSTVGDPPLLVQYLLASPLDRSNGRAIVKYKAQDRPDMALTTRVLFQRMAVPTRGIEYCLKRPIRQFASHPCGVLTHPRGIGSRRALRIPTDSDWVADVTSRKSHCGGYIQRNGGDQLPMEQDQGKFAKNKLG